MKTKTKRTIERVVFRRMPDTDSDTSWIGEYSPSAGPDDKTIDRYFVATNSAAETGNPDSVEQDYQRMEALNRGDWFFIGVEAVANVVIGGTCQKITSGGLWGIESDCGREYMEELRREQLAELRSILRDLGFNKRAIEDAFAECEDAD